MRSNRGIFWYSLGLTLLLLLPMVLTVAFFTDQYQKQQLLRQASAADSTLHIEPGAQGVYTLLLVVQQEEPAFVLARLDGAAKAAALETVCLPEDAGVKSVTWESSAPEVASVYGGRVVGLGEGTATITAKCGKASVSCTVTVTGELLPFSDLAAGAWYYDDMRFATAKELLNGTGDGHMEPSAGWTNIYIYPGYRFKVMDALITNFHLPQSTLIMLVSALAGREHVLHAYEEAVKERYRFFSFGDAMFIS